MMNKSSWSNWVDKPSDYCTHLMAKLCSLNQISLNQVDQIKLNKSSQSNNDEQLESVKSGLLHQVNQNQLSRQS